MWGFQCGNFFIPLLTQFHRWAKSRLGLKPTAEISIIHGQSFAFNTAMERGPKEWFELE